MQVNVVGGNGIGWRIVVNKYLMDVIKRNGEIKKIKLQESW